MEAAFASLGMGTYHEGYSSYHKGHKGSHEGHKESYHEDHEEHEGNLSATESHGLNTDGLNYKNNRGTSVKTSENPCSNNDLRDLRGLRGERECRGETETLVPHPSPLDPRVKLGVPMILSVTGMVNSFTLTWGAVANAYSYTVQYSQDPTFATGAQTGIANAPSTSYTVPGREPDTLYYVRVKSYPNLPGDDTASDYSGTQSVRTLLLMPGTTPGGNDNNASQLQNWFANLESELENMQTLVPDLGRVELDTTGRKRLNGSGSSRWGFIEKVLDLSLDFPQFWPGITDSDALGERVEEIEVLRNLLVWFRKATRMVGDLLLLVGDDAFRIAGGYYAASRDGARRRNPDAVQVFNMLRTFWKFQRRITGQTKKKALSHAKEVADGKRDGSVTFFNEKDQIIEGDRGFVDDSYPKGRGPRSEERETLEEE
jgi:hypothetical protein